MDVILHLGAHRTGTTSFQTYLRSHRAALDGMGIGFWGPWRTRNGLLDGVTDKPSTSPQARRAAGRIQLNLQRSQKSGKRALIVSDENLIGAPRKSLRAGRLYPDIGERLARVHAGFGRIDRVVLQIRSLDIWWASALSFLVARGHAVPGATRLQELSHSARSWRHVVMDVACACPDADIQVTPFERFAGRPDRQLAMMSGQRFVPAAGLVDFWANKSPDLPSLRDMLRERGDRPDRLPQAEGRWMPFDTESAARLRETYSDDLFWLRAGAEGLATLTEDPDQHGPGINPGAGLPERGQTDDGPARRLAPNR